MACVALGARTWEGTRDSEGHREYKVEHLVIGAYGDGPALALQASGLPAFGSTWSFFNDLDIWAWCRWGPTSVKPYAKSGGEKHRFWLVQQTFSTNPAGSNGGKGGGSGKPDGNTKSCKEIQVEDPLLEPQKVSGSFTKYQEEAARDRFNRPIRNSAFEMIRGPKVEFDKGRGTVTIEQNVAMLQLSLIGYMTDTVNDAGLWGLPRRCVKLSSVSWDKKYYGSCYAYYTRKFDFECAMIRDPDTGAISSGFDRILEDEGTKCIKGRWDTVAASPTYGQYIREPTALYENPADFIRFKDFNGENSTVILDGFGSPYDATGLTPGTDDDTPGSISVQKYLEANFLLLGIPTNF